MEPFMAIVFIPSNSAPSTQIALRMWFSLWYLVAKRERACSPLPLSACGWLVVVLGRIDDLAELEKRLHLVLDHRVLPVRVLGEDVVLLGEQAVLLLLLLGDVLRQSRQQDDLPGQDHGEGLVDLDLLLERGRPCHEVLEHQKPLAIPSAILRAWRARV